MRFLVVTVNQEHRPDPVVPLGALLVAAAARRAGHEVWFHDACFAGEGFDAALAARVCEIQPDMVGLSMRNVDSAAWPRWVSYLAHYERAAAAVRQGAPHAVLVLGGAAFSLFPELFVERLRADAGVVGEGERAIVDLLASDPAALRGSARIVRSLPAGSSWIEPAYDLVDLPRYFAAGGAVNVQTKRGCAFGCTFCTYPQLEGKTVRPHDPGPVVDSIERLWRERGIDHLFLVDNVFNAPRSLALAFCDELQRRKLPVQWTAYATPLGLDGEVAAAMVRAGCTSLDLGVDAAAPATLAALGKPFGPGEIRTASESCREAGLKVCHSLILGGPAETWDTLEETVRTIESCRPTAVVAMLGVRLHRDTGLAVRLAEAGLLRREDIGLHPVFFISEAVRDGLEAWAVKLQQERPNWVVPGLQGERRPRIQQRLRARGIKGPLWELLS